MQNLPMFPDFDKLSNRDVHTLPDVRDEFRSFQDDLSKSGRSYFEYFMGSFSPTADSHRETTSTLGSGGKANGVSASDTEEVFAFKHECFMPRRAEEVAKESLTTTRTGSGVKFSEDNLIS